MVYVGGEEPSAGECFLCRAAALGHGSPHVVERDAATVTVLNRFPYSSGHLMVAPHRHVADITELSSSEGTSLFAAVQRAVRALHSAMRPDGFNIGVNHGSAAGASIEHLHVHVVPRWGGDTNFMPVIGDVKVLPEHIAATADRLRAAYSELARG